MPSDYIPVVRLFSSPESAAAADTALADSGFKRRRLVPAASDRAAATTAVDAAIADGFLPKVQRKAMVAALGQGSTIVSVQTVFGTGQTASRLLDSNGGTAPPDAQVRSSDPTPLSDTFGWPVLTTERPKTPLAAGWSLSGKFNWPLLINNPAPLSSMIGWKTILPRLTDWRQSFGLSLLISKAAPLSSLFGMGLLKTPPRPWTQSFGQQLLTDDPTPLSSNLNLPVLTKSQ